MFTFVTVCQHTAWSSALLRGLVRKGLDESLYQAGLRRIRLDNPQTLSSPRSGPMRVTLAVIVLMCVVLLHVDTG